MKKIILLLLFVSSNLFSQTSSVFNLQGVLRLPTGKAVADGKYNFEFKIYDHPTNLTPLSWSETHNGVDVKNGIYNLLIGSKTPFSGLAFDKLYYVGISVNGGDQMSPRVQLSASPYALSIQGTNNKIPNSGAITFDKDVWHKSIEGKDRIKFDNNSKTVLNGQVSVEGGNLSITDNGQALSLIGSDNTYIGFFPDGATTRKAYAGFKYGTSDNFEIKNEISGGNILINTTSGKVGVNNTNPEYTLDIGGTIKADNMMYKVRDYTSSNFNTNHVKITGLDFSIHKRYKIYYTLHQTGGSDNAWNYFFFNNDNIAGSYVSENYLKHYGGGQHEGSSIMGIILGFNGWGHDGYIMGEITVYSPTNDYTLVYGTHNVINFNPSRGYFSGIYKKTSKITQISFTATGNNKFGRGEISIFAIPTNGW